MIAGVGIDRCSVARVAAVQEQFGGRFTERLLTPTERTQREWTAAQLARRWAMKEAVAKALGTGIGGTVGFQQIEITYDAKGAPRCAVQGIEGMVLVSVSDDEGVAVAMALWEKP